MAEINLPLNLKTVVNRGVQLHEQEEGFIRKRKYNLVNNRIVHKYNYTLQKDENANKYTIVLQIDSQDKQEETV